MKNFRVCCATVDRVSARSTGGVTRLFAVLLAAVVLAGAAGCGSAKRKIAAENRNISSEVPAGIRTAGALRVASTGKFGPDRPLARALASVMGLRVSFFSPPFRDILSGVIGHQYDLGVSAITDTKARQKLVNFVTYFKSGISFYVRKDGPVINALSDLCGQKVGVPTRTIEQSVVAAQSSKCVSSGRPALTLMVFADSRDANNALLSGKVDVALEDTPIVSDYVHRSGGRLKITGRPFDVQPYGIASAKHSGLSKPVMDALKLLISNGKYLAILTKSGMREGAITHPKINGAVS